MAVRTVLVAGMLSLTMIACTKPAPSPEVSSAVAPAKEVDVHVHVHAHGHEGVPMQVQGESGPSEDGRWSTDAPLRAAMLHLYEASQLVQGPTDILPKAEALKLADTINDQVAVIVANCKLEPEADAVLHTLIHKLMRIRESLTQEPRPDSIVERLEQVLEEYAAKFNHPHWPSKA